MQYHVQSEEMIRIFFLTYLKTKLIMSLSWQFFNNLFGN